MTTLTAEPYQYIWNAVAKGPYTIIAEATDGLSNLSTSFRLESLSGTTFSRAEFSCYDGAGVSATITSIGELDLTKYIYPTPGIFVASISLFDRDNMLIYKGTTTLVVASIKETRRLATGALTGVLARLKDERTDLALNSFEHNARPKYTDLFAALAGRLPAIVERFGAVSTITLSETIGEIVLLRGAAGSKRAFPVTVMRCYDGIWRVVSM